MDAQLALLQEIRSALFILIYLVGAGVILNLLRTVATSYRTIKSELANSFYNTASKMHDNGNYEALVKYCHEHLVKNPMDPYPYWFLGKAYFQLKDFEKSIENFDRAKDISPSWEKDWIQPYLEKIEASVGWAKR
jgi:tetratricopeptide (TPR) repeat protein